MPGIPTHFRLFDMTSDVLDVDSTSKAFAYLGAIGPSLGDFISKSDSGQGPANSTAYWDVWNEIFALLFGYDPDHPADGNLDEGAKFPSLRNALRTLQDRTKELDGIVRRRDVSALKDMRDNGRMKTMVSAATKVQTFADLLMVNPTAFTAKIAKLIYASVNMKPSASNMPPLESELFVRDLLHWRLTGKFLRVLLRAGRQGADSVKAYSRGYLTSYAGKVSGSPFINSIVGGPYRTQWWRHRWINNYIDAWVHGFYDEGITMSGDSPSTAYEDWKARLCGAKLQDRLNSALESGDALTHADSELAVIDVLRGRTKELPWKLPLDFCKGWYQALGDTYGDLLPNGLANAGDDRQQIVLSFAALRAWLVLWLQTGSGIDGLGCPPEYPGAAPANCGPSPPWANPTIPGDNGSGKSPPEPNAETENDVGQTVSGVILFILGVIACAAGGAVFGAIAIVKGADMVIDNPDTAHWDELECTVYWYKLYRYTFCNALHDLLVKAGFAFPWPEDLDKTILDANQTPIAQGVERFKSQVMQDRYPQQRPGSLADMTAWMAFPSTGLEEPGTTAYRVAKFPNYFIDDPDNRLAPEFPRAIRLPPAQVDRDHLFKADGTQAAQPGNAVENILDMMSHLDEFLGDADDPQSGVDFPEWNLDADRGMSWWTWKFENKYDTSKVDEA